MKPSKDGYFWVKLHQCDYWQLAQWSTESERWFFCSNGEDSQPETQIKEIGPEVMPPNQNADRTNVPYAILNRTSCRSYDASALTPYQEQTLLWAAQHTPSAGNIRPLAFHAVTDAKVRTLLAQNASHQPWIASAPLIIVILADYPKIERKYHLRGRQYALLEAGHAAQNICLTATYLNLDSCCVGAFRESRVLQSLGMENSGLTPVYMVTVGRKKT